MKALIIDDEARSRSTLNRILDKYCPEIKTIDQAANAEEAYQLINKIQPDVIFLDIEMPNESGFDLLKRFESIDFEIIFTTGFDQYALQAIKISALDYVLKPLDVEEIMAAVKKVKASKKSSDLQPQIASMMAHFQSTRTNDDRIALPTHYGLTFVAVKNIIRLEAQDNYCRIHIQDQKPILCTRTLLDFEEMLKGYPFIRCHRKHLINRNHLSKYFKGEGGYVEMNDGSTVTVSRRRKDIFLKSL